MAASLIPTAASLPSHALLYQPHHTTSVNNITCSNAPLALSKQLIKAKASAKFTVLCSTAPASSSSVVEEENSSPPPLSAQAGVTNEAADKLPPRGCIACGRDEIERGCNGEGRIQGGIATFPGFGWWPIKAYRPCPGLVESGGRYTRRGQSMDEVTSGSSRREVQTMSLDEIRSSKKS